MKTRDILTLFLAGLMIGLFTLTLGCNSSSGGKKSKKHEYTCIHFGPEDFLEMPDDVKQDIAALLASGIYTDEGRVNDVIPEEPFGKSWRHNPEDALSERVSHPGITMFGVCPETAEIKIWYYDNYQITGFNFSELSAIVEVAEFYLDMGKAQETVHETWEGYGPPWKKRVIYFRDGHLSDFQSGPDAWPMAEALSTGWFTADGEIYGRLEEEPLEYLFDAQIGQELIVWLNGGSCEQGVVWNVTFSLVDESPFEYLETGVKYYARFLEPEDADILEDYVRSCGYGSPEEFDSVPASECY